MEKSTLRRLKRELSGKLDAAVVEAIDAATFEICPNGVDSHKVRSRLSVEDMLSQMSDLIIAAVEKEMREP